MLPINVIIHITAGLRPAHPIPIPVKRRLTVCNGIERGWNGVDGVGREERRETGFDYE